MDVAAGLVGGRPIDAMAVGTHDGRLDLRGFAVPSPEAAPSGQLGRLRAYTLEGVFAINGLSWRGLDLSSASLPSLRFTGARIEDCVFADASCPDWRLWNTTISRTAFVKTDLRDVVMGIREGPTNCWTDVLFSETDFGELWVWCGEFLRCIFDRPRMRDTRFLGCVIEDSKFVGPLTDVLFDFRKEINPKSHIAAVDFSEATFSEVHFAGFNPERIKLPATQDLTFTPHWAEVLRRQLQALPEEDSARVRGVRAVLENALRGAGESDSSGVFNREDWANRGGEELANFAQGLFEAALRD